MKGKTRNFAELYGYKNLLGEFLVRDLKLKYQGSALGFLWSLDHISPDRAVKAVARAARPEYLGDFLTGLFALAREQVTGSPEVVTVIDQVLSDLDSPDFLVALPSLRLAFGYFPPREKDRLARTILTLHGNDPDQARSLTRRLPVNPEVVARGLRLDGDVEKVMGRFGLGHEKLIVDS